MREERTPIAGDLLIVEPTTLWSSVAGNVRVAKGGKLYIRGTVYGDVAVEVGGRCHIYGNVTGNLTVSGGAKCIHTGMIVGNATNRGGRLFIERSGKIQGKVRTHSGTTAYEHELMEIQEDTTAHTYKRKTRRSQE